MFREMVQSASEVYLGQIDMCLIQNKALDSAIEGLSKSVEILEIRSKIE